MPQQNLRQSLERLHAQLASATEIDAGTRERLRKVADEIEGLLARREAEPDSLRQRVDEAAIRFEASHPQLAHTLEEITDALAKLGF